MSIVADCVTVHEIFTDQMAEVLDNDRTHTRYLVLYEAGVRGWRRTAKYTCPSAVPSWCTGSVQAAAAYGYRDAGRPASEWFTPEAE